MIALLAIAAVLAMPWLLFWSIATLTGFTIPYTLGTWAAAWVLVLIMGGSTSAGKQP